MRFKENLLKKIKIDQISKTVLESIGPPDSDKKVNKDAMKSLLEMSRYQYRKERDLDLYILETAPNQFKILVLDNDLAIYHTAVEDVAMRKSPTIKEMLSIRNAIKILNDSDVLVSKKETSVKTIQSECIGMLDLSYTSADIEGIAKDGITSLENGYVDGVQECLTLFSELLGYVAAPKAFVISHHRILGRVTAGKPSEVIFGPIVIYHVMQNTIRLIEEPISSLDKAQIELLHQVASGKQKASAEGVEVFEWLRQSVPIKTP